MDISEVLHAAVAGGYQIDGSDGIATAFSGANREYSVWTRSDNQSSFMIPVHDTFLDPVFWHALGRALGWDAPCALVITCVHAQHECRRADGAYWMYQWHCFIQHLAEGNSPDAFFAHLPTPRPCNAPRPPGRRSRPPEDDASSSCTRPRL
jgi:hypothetical protein